jgi:DNA methylase
MTPHLTTNHVRLFHGDCREVLRGLPDASVDSVVTDPPYELGFMGKAWDAQGVAYDTALWAEVLRVLKPGGHLLAFGGTRTYHRLACAVEDAGFEIRDSIHWLYGSGFPKSLDVSKAIDKAAGAEREIVGSIRMDQPGGDGFHDGEVVGGYVRGDERTRPIFGAPATPEAARWEGWGTALKPAHEPVVVARKPLAGTVAANVLAHGTGALNVDGCRVAHDEECRTIAPQVNGLHNEKLRQGGRHKETLELKPSGRWPANVVLDPEAAEVLDRQSGDLSVNRPAVYRRDAATAKGRRNASSFDFGAAESGSVRSGFGDSGGASRFFTVAGFTDDDLTSFRYVAKPDRAERNAGLDGNFHPTVKPLDLMRWLVRLVTPPGGTVLEPFAGSGTTLAAAVLEGFDAVGIELTADYLPLIEGRVRWAEAEARFGPVTGPTKVRKETPGAVSLFDEVDE